MSTSSRLTPTSGPSETTPLQSLGANRRLDESTNESSVGSLPASNDSFTIKVLKDFAQTNSFVLKAAFAIGLAKIYPPLGATYLCPQITATWLAVMFIFTMAGLSLQSKQFSNAASRCTFNIFVLVFNFGFVSLLVFGMTKVIRYYDILPKGLTDGMMVCSCMPITVTMVIVLTKSAKGDEAAAVLLAAVGSLLGVIVTPTLLVSYIGVQPDVSFPQVFLELVMRVVIPLLVGQLLQNYSTRVMTVINRHKQKFKAFQEWTLIYIVYTVFCKTFLQPIKASLMQILWMALFQGTGLILSMGFAWFFLNTCFQDTTLKVMGLYGCTHKSVALGIPMIGALYEDDPHAGLYTLPLLIWHPLQLLIGSALTPYLAARVDKYSSEALGESPDRRSSYTEMSKESFRRGSSVVFANPFDDDW